ncbi:MAG: hypothetical protein M3485_10220 [Pseudomonadota bacterium]|nr:hypothetical protein [Pseudomonadota bacterium]
MDGASHTDHFGFVKGMTKGGVDMDRVFDDHAATAKEIYSDAIKSSDKENIPHLSFVVAQFAKKTAFTALAMVKDLEERIARIEEKGVCYRGVYNASEDYSRGDLVSRGGSVFHATRDTRGLAPATGEESKELDHPWQLMVKRGRDARSSTR